MANSNPERESQEAEDLAAIVASQNPGTEPQEPSEEMEADSSPRATKKEIELELARLSRSPFRRILADMLDCAPDMKTMRALAKNNPSKFFQSMALLGQMAGYTKDSVVEHNVNVNVGNLNDSALATRLAEVQAKLLEQQKLITSQKSTFGVIAPDLSHGEFIDVPSRIKE